MRAAALLLLAACSTAAAESTLLAFVRELPRALECARSLGPARCAGAFGVWCARSAVEDIKLGGNATRDVVTDLGSFPWKDYVNVSREHLDSDLMSETVELLKHRSLNLYLPGFKANMNANDEGKIKIDLYKDNEMGTGRGSSKKLRAQFYRIVPFLLLPGLLMSAVLPFILPAMKMLTVAAGIINQMALSGAIFTLLRNNAFNDKYDHKVVYANVGYKNEYKAKQHKHHFKLKQEHNSDNNYEVHEHFHDQKLPEYAVPDYIIPSSDTHIQEYNNYQESPHQSVITENHDANISPDWVKQYNNFYGQHADLKFESEGIGLGHRKRILVDS